MMSQQQRAQEGMEQTQEAGGDMAVMAAAGSVILSWYHYFVRRNRQMGLFVGLWAPTLLAFASYAQQRAIRQRLEREPLSTTIRDTVERVMGSQR